jgi:hypothetical protein
MSASQMTAAGARAHARGVLLRAVVVGVLLLSCLVFAAPASALAPALNVTSSRYLPAAGGEGAITLEVVDLGDAPALGEAAPIVVRDVLPEGVTAVSAEGAACELLSSSVVRCESAARIPQFEDIKITIVVKVAAGASGTLVNEVTAGGGGAVTTVTREGLTVNGAASGFGVENFKLTPLNEDGTLDTQAGSHPFELTATTAIAGPDVKDLKYHLPAGLVGNVNVVPQCTSPEFGAILPEAVNACPPDTAIGVASAFANGQRWTEPLFNLVPSRGEPARFGFTVLRVPVVLDTSVRTGSDYGVDVSVSNISEIIPISSAQVTFWGVPADPAHDTMRGWKCVYEEVIGPGVLSPCTTPENPQLTPFLTLPTSCAGPGGMAASVQTDSWLEPEPTEPKEAHYTPSEGLGGCNRLPFEPSVRVAPDGPEAATPSGLTVGVHVPQEGALNPTGLSPADVRDTTVALPAGVQLNPSGADGLQACTDAQIGFQGEDPVTGTDLFSAAVPSCPDASKVASVNIKTPLLPDPLVGEVYLAAPQNFQGLPQNPFSALVAMYIVAEDPVSGVLVKLPGRVTPDPVTGQLTATFQHTPELPFEDLKLHFFGSARAPLSTPALCGSYTTQASITPSSGAQPAVSSSHFQITTGPDQTGPAGCTAPRQFAPAFHSSSTNIQAGAFTPFQLTMTRPDADQTLARIDMTMPPGLLGTLSSVKLCGDAQANAGTCGAESLIGETIVSAGLGGDPYTVTGGKVYMTEKYGGGEFGLSIVNPAKAGPFVLQEGRPVIVRAAVFVDHHTAALHIVSDPLPTIIDGIPLQLQHVNVTINRPGFTFNPTSCARMSINATLGSSEGASFPASTPFQVTNCANLQFKPKFGVSTSGKTSRANGASLAVKLTYPTGPYYANIKSVKVDLPKQLPSRLTTLQKACTAAQFEANPAGCPSASLIGHAKATTPILPVPLEGPAYFVSHGGEAFPSLIVVLQGYGVTVDLVGTTFISKAGITSSTFKEVPDVPVGTFELTLPQGKFSALAANGNLCKSKLAMPTQFVAQNGLELKQSTPIGVTGCAKGKKATKKKKHASKKKRAKR